jgi:hypothetical protein
MASERVSKGALLADVCADAAADDSRLPSAVQKPSAARLLMSFQTARVSAGSGEVPGRALSLRLPVSVIRRGSFMACVLAGCRGEAWLKKGVLGSK